MAVLQYTAGGIACCMLGVMTGLLLASFQRQSGTAPHVSLPTSAPKCDPGWHHSLVTGHCYLFKPDDLLPFNVALQTCRDMDGSDLASIHDAYEMNEVRRGMQRASILAPGAITYERYWFGLAMNETEQDEFVYYWMDDPDKFVYYWTDGTDRVYENWAGRDQPSLPEYNRCVFAYLSNGNWATGYCEIRYGFVCKKPGKGEVTSTKPTIGSGAVGVAGMPVLMVFISCLLGLMLRFST